MPDLDTAPALLLGLGRGVRFGGVWLRNEGGFLQALWPAWLPVPEPKRSFIEWLGDLFGRAQGPYSREQILECHAWLAGRIARRTSRFFMPVWRDIPTGLFRVTGQSLYWTAAAHCLLTRGPRAFRRRFAQLAPQNTATAADYVALHMAIEDVVSAWDEGTGAPVSPLRRTGGIRERSILNLWAAVAARSDASLRRRWNAISLLAAHSPLTRMTYLDVLDCPEADPASLFVVGAKNSGSEATGPYQWFETWISVVSRSLLGAVLSPPPAQEELEAAALQLEEAKAAARRRLVGKGQPVTEQEIRQHRLVAAASGRYAAVVIRVRQQYEARIPFVATTLCSNPLFQMRFIDMLVRLVTDRCAAVISADWRRLDPDQRFHIEPRTRYFFDEKAVCFEEFEKTLFGPGGMQVSAESASLSPHFDKLRLVAEGSSPAVAAAGLPNHSAQELAARFEQQPVVLPCGQFGYPPAFIWQQWMAVLINRLPAAVATEVEEQ